MVFLDGMIPVRIACVYRVDRDLSLAGMETLWVVRMAEALGAPRASLDLVMNSPSRFWLRRGPRGAVRARALHQYDVVKTFFHRGFELLRAAGGTDDPFIVSKLGSVVGGAECEGVLLRRVRAGAPPPARGHRGAQPRGDRVTDRSVALWRRTHGAAMRLMPADRRRRRDPAARREPGRAPRRRSPLRALRRQHLRRDLAARGQRAWQERLSRIGRLLHAWRGAARRDGPWRYQPARPHAVMHLERSTRRWCGTGSATRALACCSCTARHRTTKAARSTITCAVVSPSCASARSRTRRL